MSVAKRVAYLKGLMEGLKLDTETNEGKIISVVVDILDDIALEIDELKEDISSLDDDIDEISENLETLEDLVYDDEDEDEMDADDPIFFNVTCPNCDNEITIDENVLASGSMDCPNCKEKLEFDLDDLEDSCDCGHEHHNHDHEH